MHNTAIPWPNNLGYDVGDAEVFMHRDKFRVFTTNKCLLVPFAITTDPVTAVELCNASGLSREMLEYDMEPWDAQRLFQSTIPVQKQLF